MPSLARPRRSLNLSFACAAFLIAALGCRSRPFDPGTPLARTGDEIVVCGQLFHTGTPIVLWTDPGGYDAYRVERRFGPWNDAGWSATTKSTTATTRNHLDSPNRYGLREAGLTPDELERVRGGGWTLDLLRSKVDQFVIHYDQTGLSRETFRVLHDQRGLSVHFMLDLDGTIYQTLDLKERAWHATTSNGRSIGIEIANIGAYPVRGASPMSNPQREWYARDKGGAVRLAIPERLGDGGIRTPNFVGRPARNEIVVGDVQGERLQQYDYTPQQYAALAHLTATLCTVFPNLPCDYPRDAKGQPIRTALSPERLATYRGLLGHYNVQTNKIDPGPAFQWDLLIQQSRELMKQR